MHRRWTALSLFAPRLAIAACAVAATACSSPTSPADAGGGNANVSFTKDVMPIFQTNCAQGATCHGQVGLSTVEDLYLGDMQLNTPAIVETVYQGLVGVKSQEDPAMDLVTASEPSQSYLVHKLIGDQNDVGAADCIKKTPLCAMTCSTQAPCGASMPYLGPNFPQMYSPQFATIESWIAQGAKDN